MFGQRLTDGLLGSFIVVAPNISAQTVDNGIFHRLDQCTGRGFIFGPRDHPQMDAIGLGVDSQVGVLLAEKFGDNLVNCCFRQAQGLDVSGHGYFVVNQFPQFGRDLVFPHGMHLPRRARHANNALAFLLGPPSRGGAVGVGQKSGGGNQVGLFDIGRWHGHAATLKIPFQLVYHFLLHGGRLTQSPGDGLPGQVVLRRSQPTGGEDDVGALEASLKRLHQHIQVITDNR